MANLTDLKNKLKEQLSKIPEFSEKNYNLAGYIVAALITLAGAFLIYEVLTTDALTFKANWNMFKSPLGSLCWIIGFICAIVFWGKMGHWSRTPITEYRDSSGRVLGREENFDVTEQGFAKILMPILGHFVIEPIVYGAIIYYPIQCIIAILGAIFPYIVTVIVLAIIAVICMLTPVFRLKERDFVDSKASESDVMKSLGATFKNKEFLKFAASDISYWIGLTLFQTGLPFFVKVSMKLDESFTMIFLAGMTILSVCFYPVVSKLVGKFGKKKLVITGFLGLALAYVITALIGILPLPGVIFGILIVVIAAFPMALLGIIPQSIVADVAEEDGVRTGEKREGMFFAARTFSMKAGQSLAMLAFTSLAVLGTTQDITSNDLMASPTGLRIVSIVAVAFCLLGAAILGTYDEKKVMGVIESGKAERN